MTMQNTTTNNAENPSLDPLGSGRADVAAAPLAEKAGSGGTGGEEDDFVLEPCAEVWDNEYSEWARGWDGSIPLLTNRNTVLIKSLVCNCSPPGCGGCADAMEEYDLGDRFALGGGGAELVGDSAATQHSGAGSQND